MDYLYVTENLKELFRGVSETEFKKFFQSLRDSKLRTVGSLSTESLTIMQASVNMITEMENIFIQLRQSKPTNE